MFPNLDVDVGTKYSISFLIKTSLNSYRVIFKYISNSSVFLRTVVAYEYYQLRSFATLIFSISSYKNKKILWNSRIRYVTRRFTFSISEHNANIYAQKKMYLRKRKMVSNK